jgi:hypothetical protein
MERVKAAETALFNRLQVISNSNDSHAEWQAIERRSGRRDGFRNYDLERSEETKLNQQRGRCAAIP